MQRFDTTGDPEEPQLRAIDGQQVTGRQVALASAEDVTFPAVWLDGDRVYDVEVWHDGSLVATVPPQSEEVDASFAEHERRRAG